MTDYRLVLGNKNYSSWSLRAWLALRQSGAAFEEIQLWIDEDPDRQHRLRHSPAGRVPVLLDGDFAVWDTLAIGEYLAERFPDAGLWPAAPRARARARSLCAEMHAGFEALRTVMPMNCSVVKPARDRGPAVAAEVERIVELWSDTRAEFGADGDFLFGQPSLADVFFAPVASRFRTYSIPLHGAATTYRDAVLAQPAMRDWMAAAAAESHVMQAYASQP